MAGAIGGLAAGRGIVGVATGRGIVAANRGARGLDVGGVARDIAKLAVRDGKAGGTAFEAAQRELTPLQRGQLQRALPDAIAAEQRAVRATPAGLTPKQRELALDMAQMGLDVVGMFEPTPFADIASGLISLARGDLLGAGISTASMIPYVGDAAKLGKIGKWARTAATAIEVAKTDSRFAHAIRPSMEKLGAGLNAIPGRALDALPASARKQIFELRARIDGFLKGREVTVLDGGTTGAWSKVLNARLKANADYLVNGYLYKTDAMGRIASVEGKIDLTVAARNGYQQAKAGRAGQAGDQGGHLIASIFNGPGEKFNIVPMNGNFNMGAWKVMENRLASAAARPGARVEIKIETMYAGSSGRPEGFVVQAVIDGKATRRVFENKPGG